jgi:sugar phosphate permease
MPGIKRVYAPTSPKDGPRALVLFALIAAGEAVFVLPFVVARVFRPTLLDVFGVTNLQLGTAFAAYGVVAMVSYFFGGPLADRFSARRLIAIALVATALGGLFYASIPSMLGLGVLFGFWGMTTILLFWSALIRATREWGGADAQGRAYGLLDGGRGLFAALLASATVAVFAALLPADAGTATLEVRTAALQQVILICTGLTLSVAALVWWWVPEHISRAGAESALSFAGVRRVVRMPVVWLQAVIIVCAYVGYKATDYFALYAFDVQGYDEVAAARLGTVTFWTRPVAAVAVGFLADRISGSLNVILGFTVLAAGSLVMGFELLPLGVPAVLVATVITTGIGIYGVRAVYYAIMQEGRIPLAVTGSAVGVVSVLGYTPDVFAGPLFGYLLDASPGAAGYRHLFFMLAGFSAVGLVAAIHFRQLAGR